MKISVPLSKWGPRIRAQVVGFATKWPTLSWGTYPGHDPSEARATDGMVPLWQSLLGRKLGQQVADWIWENRRKNGIWYVIFNGRIISTTYPNAGWRHYFAASDPNPSKSHKNHVHCSWHEESSAPVVYSEPVAPYTEGYLPSAEVFYLDRQGPGVTASDSVWFIQRALGLKPRDGNWLPEREGVAVSKWQRTVAKNDPRFCDGILGPKDARKLFGKAFPIEAHS